MENISKINVKGIDYQIKDETIPIPNNEDISIVHDDILQKDVYQLADRIYDESNFSGKGYKILRKNIVDGKNILTQEMINEPNTIYEIRYEYTVPNISKEIEILNSKEFKNSIIYYSEPIIIPQNSCIVLDKNCYFMWENVLNTDNYRNVLFTNNSELSIVIASLKDLKKTKYTIFNKINIPENSVLLFNGGNINKIGFTFNKTLLLGNIIFKNSYFEGVIKNEDIYMSWFTNDDDIYSVGYTYQFFQTCQNGNKRLFIGNKHIFVKTSSFTNIDSLNVIGDGNKSIIEIEPTLFRKAWDGGIYFSKSKNIVFDNVTFQAPDLLTTDNNPLYAPICLSISDIDNVEIKKCIFKDMPYISPIGFTRIKNLSIHDNEFYDYDSGIINNGTSEIDINVPLQIINIYNNTFAGNYSASEPITISTHGLCHVFIHDNYISNKTSASGISIGNKNNICNVNSKYEIYNNIIENIETCIVSFGGEVVLNVHDNYIKPSGTKHIDLRGNSSIIARNNIFASNKAIIQITKEDNIKNYALFENNIFEYNGGFSLNGSKLICNNNIFKENVQDISFYDLNEIEITNNKCIKNILCRLNWIDNLTNNTKKIIRNNNFSFNLGLNNYIPSKDDIFENITSDSYVDTDWQGYTNFKTYLPIYANNSFIKDGQTVDIVCENRQGYKGYFNLFNLKSKLKIVTTKPYLGQFVKGEFFNLKLKKIGDYFYDITNSIYNDNIFFVEKNNFLKLYTKEDIQNELILKENIFALRILSNNCDFLLSINPVSNIFYGDNSILYSNIIDKKIAKEKIYDFFNDYNVIEENNIVNKYITENSGATMPLFSDCFKYKAYEEDKLQWLMPTGGYISLIYGLFYKINDYLSFLNKETININNFPCFLQQLDGKLDSIITIGNNGGIGRTYVGSNPILSTYPISILTSFQQLSIS